MSVPRILHTNFLHGWGGQSNRILTVCKGLSAIGWDVLISAPADSQLLARSRASGLAVSEKVRYVGGAKPGSVPDIFAMRRLLGEFQPDIIHLHGGKDSWVVSAAMAVRSPVRKPLIIRTKHNVFPVADHFLNRWQYGRFFDWIVCLSTAIVDQLRAKPYVNPDRLVLIPSAIEPDRFRVAPDTRDRIRSELGFTAGELVIGMTGRLCSEKGHDVLFAAMPAVISSCPNARFLVVGAGTLKGELARCIDSNRLSGAVHMTGFRQDVPDCLAAMDVYVQPSRSEGLGTSVLEASAAGLPIVASRTGGIPDVVLDGETGLLVEPESAEDLAAGILRLAGDPELRRKLGDAARNRVAAEFCVSKLVSGTHAMYRRVLGRGPD